MALPVPTWRNVFYPPAGYGYFRAGVPETSTASGDDRRAAWAADCAMLAYGRDGEAPLPWDTVARRLGSAGFVSARSLGEWDRPGPQGFFAVHARFAVVAFRGTEAGDPRDLLADFDALPVEEPPAATAPCLVHGGFKKYLDRLWPETEDLLAAHRRQFPSADIGFTGHSMGAAMATIAASRFREGGCSLYTFGCPRTGNAVLHDRVRANTGDRWSRFVNNRDLVTMVPLALFQYEHDRPSLRHIDEQGRISKDSTPAASLSDVAAIVQTLAGLRMRFDTPLLDQAAPPALVDHSPGRYCELLWSHAGE